MKLFTFHADFLNQNRNELDYCQFIVNEKVLHDDFKDLFQCEKIINSCISFFDEYIRKICLISKYKFNVMIFSTIN